jgi:ribose transport system substrate-binding protein
VGESTEAKLHKVIDNGMLKDPMSRRAFLSVAGAAGLSFGLAACGSSSSSSSTSSAAAATGSGTSTGGSAAASITRGKQYVDVTTLSNEYFVLYADGARQQAAALGLSVDLLQDNANAETGLSQVGTVSAAQGKMYTSTPATEGVVPGTVKQCMADGIYYANAYTAPAWYTPPDGGDFWTMFLTPPSASIAYVTAQTLFKHIGGEGTVIHVPGQKGSSADTQRTAGFNKALKEFPKIKVVTTGPGNWESQTSATAFSNVLPSVSDFQAVFAQNDSEAAGVIQVLDSQGIKGKAVSGFDGNSQNVQYIAQGKQLLTSVTLGGLTGGTVGVAVFDALNGVKRPLASRMMFQEALMVQENIAQEVYDKIYKAKELPFDWVKMSQALHPHDWDPQCRLTPIDPNAFFAGQPHAGYSLNSAYSAGSFKSELKQVTEQYKSQYKSGPLQQWESGAVYS